MGPSACPDEKVLAGYAAGALPDEEKLDLENHIASCPACLKKISIAARADTIYKESGGPPVLSAAAARKAGLIAAGRRKKVKSAKRHLWLFGTIAAFGLSFVFPRYFLQCLAAAILLGIKWIMESENMRTLILVLDSWRKHDHTRDDEIAGRLRDRGNIKTLK